MESSPVVVLSDFSLPAISTIGRQSCSTHACAYLLGALQYHLLHYDENGERKIFVQMIDYYTIFMPVKSVRIKLIRFTCLICIEILTSSMHSKF